MTLFGAYTSAFDVKLNKRKPGAFNPDYLKKINYRFLMYEKVCDNKKQKNKIRKLRDIALDNYKGELSDKEALAMIKKVTSLDPRLQMLAEKKVSMSESFNKEAREQDRIVRFFTGRKK